MRQIGTLPIGLNPNIFGDYLLASGTACRMTQSAGGWDVWVIEDDHIPQARAELVEYLRQPDDPKYQSAKTIADNARRESERLDREFQRNYRRVGTSGNRIDFRGKPLTAVIMAVCIGLFLFAHFSPKANFWIDANLLFFPMDVRGETKDFKRGLDAILEGEVWRLWTPALLHGSIPHIGFNMWALYSIGSFLELRKGTKFLALAVFFSALVSNLAQFAYMVYVDKNLHFFLGFSGVIYALFGYLWIIGRVAPERGVVLTTRSVQIMLLWLALGFYGFNFANGAHLGGLLFGVLMGLARL